MYFAVDSCDYVDFEKLLTGVLDSTGLNWMALVDGAFDLQNRNAPEWPNKEFLFEYAGFNDVIKASPFLLPLATDNSSVLKKQLSELIEHRKARPMLSFLSSKHSVRDICSRWKNFVNVSDADDQDFILRFADTRILEILPICLSSNNWSGLSNMLENWVYFDRQGKLSMLPINRMEYEHKHKIELDKIEFGCFVDKCEPDAIIDFLYANQSELLDQRPPYFIYKRIKSVSEFSRINNVENFSDVVALATFDLISDIPIAENIALGNLIRSRKWSSGNLIDALIGYVE